MRVAAVAYLNADPLVRGLPWDVERMLPAAMTMPRLSDYDLVLAPVVLAFAHPEWEILPDAPAIGCLGAVGSVRLEFAPGFDLHSATHFGLSPESQTSNHLLRVLLTYYWHRPLETLHFHQGCSLPTGHSFHAYVVIGDRALQAVAGPGAIDLGGAWHDWTGLPFLFACWMRRGVGPAVDTAVLRATRDRNLATLATWLPPTSPLRHFTEHLVYDFDPAQSQGLALFREYVTLGTGYLT